MKLKSFVTATLALGLLSTVGAALPSHEASADSNNGYKELTMDGKHTVPYTLSQASMVLLHYIELTLFFQKIKRYFIKKLTVK